MRDGGSNGRRDGGSDGRREGKREGGREGGRRDNWHQVVYILTSPLTPPPSTPSPLTVHPWLPRETTDTEDEGC